jgi:hypothetical protein
VGQARASDGRDAGVTRLLIAGVPRSGTTWVGQALGRTDGAVYVNEPDGDHDPFAFRARVGRPFPPALAAGDLDPDFERLFAGAFAGGRYAGTPRDRVARRLYRGVPIADRWRAWLDGSVSPKLRLAAALAVPRVAVPGEHPVIVKSVRSELAMEWLVDRFEPRVLLVERNPLNVLASWVELEYARDPKEAAAVAVHARRRWDVAPPRADEPRLVHQAFEYGVLAGALRESAARHDEWTVVRHEQLCVDPVTEFRALVAALGLTWNASVEEFLTESDREGTGYQTNRRARDQPERWRERLDAEQVETIRATLACFPVPLLSDP